MKRRKKPSIINVVKENLEEVKHVQNKETSKTCEIKIFEENGEKGIEGNYCMDLDLEQIYIIVNQCLREKKNLFLPIISKELDDCKANYRKNFEEYTQVQLKEKYSEIQDLQLKLDFLNNCMENFDIKAKEILEEYKILPEPKDKIDIHSEEYITRHNCIKNFLEMTKIFIPVNITHDLNIKSICLCVKPPKNFETVGEGCKVCPVCGYEITVFDTNRTAATPKTSYDDWGNFEKAIQNFQGLQCKPIPENLEEKLDNYFRDQGLPIGKDIREKPLNENGKKDGTSRPIMLQALNAVGYTETTTIQLIMANYWGWSLPNLSRYMDEIQNRYEQSKPYYYLFKDNRKSSLGAQFRLYQILFSINFEVDTNDFKLVMTPDLQRDYNNKWGPVASALGWKWKPL